MSKIRVSIPNMGNSWVAFKTLIESVPDIEVQLPAPVSRRTVELGAKYSPEFVCLPFKINIGDFILTHEKYGIDTFVTALDCGPCRFGFYHAVQERILKDLGYDFRIIALDQADLLTFNWVKTFDEFHDIIGEKSPVQRFFNTSNAAIKFLRKAKLVEDMENLESYYRCREMNKGEAGRTIKKMMPKLDSADTIGEIRSFRSDMVKEFTSISHDDTLDPLKVTLTGEIHIVLEPFVNLDIRKKLGDMGIEVHQSLSLLDWVKHKFHINFHRRELARLAKPYLKMDIGGEAQWVLGEYVESTKKGFDGLIHIYPFTCMPEVTARSIITAMDEPKLPALFFSFDEHTGTEGMRTRLEAFMDLLDARKRKNLKIQAEDKYEEQETMIAPIINNVNDPMQAMLDGTNQIFEFVQKIDPVETISNFFKIVTEPFTPSENSDNQKSEKMGSA